MKNLSKEQLERKIVDMSTAYYEGKPIVSDKVFDDALNLLKSKDPDSRIFDMVGWGYEVTGEKREHKVKTRGLPKIQEGNPNYKSYSRLLVTPKFDGISATLYYNNGVLEEALTRGGDSGMGKPITHNIIGASRKANIFKVPSYVKAISCEVVVKISDFKKLQGYELPRSAAAGIVQTKSVNEDNKYLTLCPYRIHFNDKEELAITDDTTKAMFQDIVKVPCCYWTKNPKDLETWVNSLDYPQDGVVLGDKVALKFKTEIVETEVISIERNISKLGSLIPVLNLKPVRLYGTTVSRCTMINEGWVEAHKVGPGSRIKLTKANQIIPQFIETIESVNYVPITECPNCYGRVIRNGDHLLCVNNCNSEKARIYSFIFTHASLLGYSEATLDKILAFNNIKTFKTLLSKLGKLTNRGLTNHEKEYLTFLNNKFNGNLYLQDLLVSLNLPGVGKTWSVKLSNNIDDYCCLGKAFPFNININVLDSIYSNIDLIGNTLKRFNWVKKMETTEKIKVTITGKLSMTKDEFCNKHNLVQTTIKESNLLIYANESSMSSKMQAALKSGAKLMSEDEFIESIQS